MADESLRDRHTRLDQALKDHLAESEKRFENIEQRFDTNDHAHDLLHREVKAVHTALTRYDGMARGIMVVLLFIGSLLTWTLDHGKTLLKWLDR